MPGVGDAVVGVVIGAMTTGCALAGGGVTGESSVRGGGVVSGGGVDGG